MATDRRSSGSWRSVSAHRRRSRRSLSERARRARRPTTVTRGSVRVAATSYEAPKLSTTEDTADTEDRWFLPLCPLCPPWWRAFIRAIPDARPETDVGHPAPGRRSAERIDLGPADSRSALEQHHQPPGAAARRRQDDDAQD